MVGENEELIHPIKWIDIIIKLIIFTILVIIVVYIVSTGAEKMKVCQTIEDSIYVLGYIDKSQYDQEKVDNRYKYNLTLEFKKIDLSNSKNIRLESANYIHSKEEYKELLDNTGYISLNQTNYDTLDINENILYLASLTPENFIFNVTDIYDDEEKYYIDIEATILNYDNTEPYKNTLFIPIRLDIQYKETKECKQK